VLGYLPWEDPGPGAPILDYVHPEDRLLAEAALQDLLRHPGTTLEYRLRVLDKEGGVRAVRVWGRNLLQDEAIRAWWRKRAFRSRRCPGPPSFQNLGPE
jgi:hypothetical protein